MLLFLNFEQSRPVILGVDSFRGEVHDRGHFDPCMSFHLDSSNSQTRCGEGIGAPTLTPSPGSAYALYIRLQSEDPQRFLETSDDSKFFQKLRKDKLESLSLNSRYGQASKSNEESEIEKEIKGIFFSLSLSFFSHPYFLLFQNVFGDKFCFFSWWSFLMYFFFFSPPSLQ